MSYDIGDSHQSERLQELAHIDHVYKLDTVALLTLISSERRWTNVGGNLKLAGIRPNLVAEGGFRYLSENSLIHTNYHPFN